MPTLSLRRFDAARRRRWVVMVPLAMGVGLLLLCLLLPLAVGVVTSVRSAPIGSPGSLTLGNFLTALHNSSAPKLIANTLLLTAGGAVGATALGILMAWAITSTDVPAARLLYVLPAAPALLPGLLKDTAWIELYAPKSGLVNFGILKLFGGEGSVFDIYSLTGMVVILALSGTPITYFILLAPFSALGRDIEDASRTCGAGPLRTFIRVVIPSVGPAILSALALSAMLVATAFETPILIGLPGGVFTYLSAIFKALSGTIAPNYNLAAADSTLYLLFGAALLIWYMWATRAERRFATIVGRGYQRSRTRLGPLRWVLLCVILAFFFFSFVQLLGVTVLVSFLQYYTVSTGNPFEHFTVGNYRGVTNVPGVGGAIATSLVLAAIAAVVGTGAGLLVAMIAIKSRFRFRRWLEIAGTFPIALPPLVFSIFLLDAILFIPGLSALYLTIVPLAIAIVIVALPYVIRVLSGAVLQLHDDLAAAARVCGAGVGGSVWSVMIPLLRVAIASSLVLVFALSFRELGSAVLLISPGTQILPTLVFTEWGAGKVGTVAVLNILSCVVSALVIVASVGISGVAGRRGRREGEVRAQEA